MISSHAVDDSTGSNFTSMVLIGVYKSVILRYDRMTDMHTYHILTCTQNDTLNTPQLAQSFLPFRADGLYKFMYYKTKEKWGGGSLREMGGV